MTSYKLALDKHYLTVEGTYNLFRHIGGKIKKNQKRYFNALNKKPHLKNFYLSVAASIKNMHEIQVGGKPIVLPFVIGGMSFSVVVTSILLYVLYRWATSPTCRDNYPLLKSDSEIDIKDVLLRLFPENFFNIDGESTTFLNELRNQLDIIKAPLAILMPEDTIGQIGVSIVNISAGIAATVGSLGFGGDTIVNLIFLFKDIIETIFSVLDNIVYLVTDEEVLRILYDVFSIDFRDGPFGVECWVKALLNKHGKKNRALSIACGFLSKIMDKMANFIGSAISTLIPDDAGIVGVTISTIIKLAKKNAFRYTIAQLKRIYRKIPYDQQLLIEKPSLMKVYLDSLIVKVKKIFMGYSEDVFATLKDNTAFFSVMLNKMFALMFAILYISSTCTV